MFEKVDIHSLSFNPFDKVGKDWLLISATKNGKTNTMTASWGTLGHLWNKNVAIIFIRPQRYTKEFVDEQPSVEIGEIGIFILNGEGFIKKFGGV